MYLGELPVWKGVHDAPGFQTLPFELGIEQGLVRLNLRQDQTAEIVDRYGAPSYTFITTPPGHSEWGSALGAGFFNDLVQMVGSLDGKNVLEIGSGSLYIARRVTGELRARRFTACDPALQGVPSEGAIEVVPDYFSADRFARDSFDVIVSLNALEHVPDPFQFLRDVRTMLASTNGVFFVVIPDCTRGFEAGDLGICLHEHLNYFTVASFTHTVRRLGFAIQALRRENDKITAVLTAAPADPNGAGDDCGLLDSFERQCAANLEHCRRLFDTGLQQPQSIGCHGCSVGLNNVLALLGVHSAANLFLFDGDSIKAGKYLPTFDRPILPATDARYATMSTLIVAVSTFYPAIRSLALTRGYRQEQIVSLMPVAS